MFYCFDLFLIEIDYIMYNYGLKKNYIGITSTCAVINGINSNGFDSGFCMDTTGPIVSTAHLIDIAGFRNETRLAVGYEITEDDFYGALDAQGIDINN